MKRHRIPRFFFLVAILLFGSWQSLSAEVVHLKDGTILIGELLGPTANGVSYSVMGQNLEIPIASIQKTEKTLEGLSTLNVELTLKDGSSIRGRIVDLDLDIGLFLDISFGTLTIPVQAIQSIDNPVLKRKFVPVSVQFRGGGGFQYPFFGNEKNFGPSWYSQAGFDWSLPGLRGWQLGLQAEGYGMNYLTNPNSQYQMYALVPRLTYQYLGLRSEDSLASLLTPFVGAGAGPAYILMKNSTISSSGSESLTLEVSAFTGVQVNLFYGLALKLEGFTSVVLQKTLPYVAGGAALSLCWEQ